MEECNCAEINLTEVCPRHKFRLVSKQLLKWKGRWRTRDESIAVITGPVKNKVLKGYIYPKEQAVPKGFPCWWDFNGNQIDNKDYDLMNRQRGEEKL